MSISTDAEKDLDKIQHSFRTKTKTKSKKVVRKWGIKNNYKTPIANRFNGGKLDAFPKIGNKARIYPLITSI